MHPFVRCFACDHFITEVDDPAYRKDVANVSANLNKNNISVLIMNHNEGRKHPDFIRSFFDGNRTGNHGHPAILSVQKYSECREQGET